MNAAAAAVHRAFNRPLARYWLTARFDPVFWDGPSLQWGRMNLLARRRFQDIDPQRFTHVGMFSFSRAGSHLFESQFHYIPSCFCFGEAHMDFRFDLNWRTFLCRGMYRTDSMQDKRGTDLTHLFYNCNKKPIYLDDAQWTPADLLGYHRQWVLVMRNPLRVLLSRSATGKNKWQMTEPAVEEFLAWFEKARRHFSMLLERRPNDTHVVSVEQFVASPDAVLGDLAKRLGLEGDTVTSRPDARGFFRVLSRTGEAPVEREGYLSSPTRSITIQGWGGEFNPLLKIDPDRLYRHPVVDSIPANILLLAKARLGARAFEFYMNDRDHRFERVNARDLLEL